jgi:hypothetical protein
MAAMNRPLILMGMGAVLLATVGCSGGDAGPTTVVPPREVVELGVLPDSPTPIAPPATPPTTPPTTVFTRPVIERIDGKIAEVVEGNRLLLIGDTSMATLTERQGGLACTVFSEQGWQVRVEAEVGRFVSFAEEVVETVVIDSGEGWDVVGLMFGLHIDTPPDEFAQTLDSLVGRLDGRPVMLYTVAERVGPDGEPDEIAAALNLLIRAMGVRHPNAVVIEWAGAVNTEEQAVLVDDERVPTAPGMGRIVLLTAAALGEYPWVAPPASSVPGSSVPVSSAPETSAPATSVPEPAEGACLPALYTDDSAILL